MKRLLSFLLLSFLLPWLLWFGLWWAGVPLTSPIFLVTMALGMWCPALAYGLTRCKQTTRLSFKLQVKTHWPLYLFAKSGAYDIMILDVMMPVMTGIEALTAIRERGDKTYTLMLTAMSEVDDKVMGLSAGADDYLTKPISLKELLARLAAIERRLHSYTDKVLTVGTVHLDLAEQELSASNSIRLAGKEVQMMAYFMHNLGKPLSTAALYQHVWGDDDDASLDEGYVWIYVSYLRQKLAAIAADVEIIGDRGGSFHLIQSAGERHV